MLNELMRLVSSEYTWLAIGYVMVVYAGIRKIMPPITTVLLMITAVAVCHLFCVHVLTPWLRTFASCQPVAGSPFGLNLCASEFGLPSVHAADAMAAAAVAWYMSRDSRRPWGLLAVGTAVVVGISRVYLGFHLLGDILTAFSVGALVGSAIFWSWHVVSARFLLALSKDGRHAD